MADTRSTDPIDIALHCARAALGMMERHRVPPHPENFSIWYAYVSGRNPELTEAINEILRTDSRFSPDVNDSLYERFAAFAPDKAELREVGQRVEEAVGRMLDYLSHAAQGTNSYGAALETFSGCLSTEDPTPDQISEAISAILLETRTMTDLNHQLERRLAASGREIRQLRDALDSLQREASTDALTQLANRKTFDTVLAQAVREAEYTGRPLCLLMVDVDHFKTFNDTYGHPLGDQILKLIGRILVETVQPKDTAARYGGEEFSVILPGTNLDSAITVADDLRLRVAGRRVTNRRTGETLGQVTLSVGVAQFIVGESITSLIHRADEALYLAKREGRNQVLSQRDLPLDRI
ncbi:GGDEF domain-containing protein [Magnetospirillum molischianum]|uniref:diguanylate cyclase n=1 Tax=Magnetospirillum molischianum DSM 120 TaxID=1150626 RepID=H8FQJ4_MAGML|nr:GGDEF domain-containing protein [Magnetospirillum molischianum]CCG40632.1 GGDEF domain [Magnetospirillum molischianum DSM 120]